MGVALDDQHDLEFADVRVERRAHRVLKGGVEVPLEPKAFGVLLELIAHAGEMVTRDALLDAVWGHRHVTPAVLNRVIAMLRRAIGDDADAPHAIQTVHGLGYRFAATLRVASGDPAAPSAAAASGSVATPPPARTQRSAWHGQAGGVLLLGVALLGLAFAAWKWWPRAESPAGGAVRVAEVASAPVGANEPVSVAMLPLVLEGGAESDRAVADGLTRSLDDMLQRLPDVHVAALESAHVALTRTGEARAAADLLGVEYVLHGTLTPQSGGAVALDLELTRTRDGVPAWTSAFQQPRDQLFRIMGPTLDGVQRILRPARPAQVDPLLRASASAQDVYWLAQQQLYADLGDGRSEVIALLERAVRLDPQFALPYCSLARAYRLEAIVGRVGLEEGAAKAKAAAARALEIDPTLLCAHLESVSVLTTQWRSPEAAIAMRRTLELAPNDANVLAIAGNIAAYNGRPRDALELHLLARAADPLNPGRSEGRWIDLMLLGRYDEALAVADQLHTGTARLVWGAKVRVLYATGRFAEALDFHARDPDRESLPLFERLTAAQAYSQLGLHDSAEALVKSETPIRSSPPLYAYVRLNVFWSARRYAAARDWIEGEGALAVQEPWRSAWRGQARALAGDARGALADYDAALAQDLDRDTVAYCWLLDRMGVVQLANWAALRKAAGHDPAEAIAAYSKALQHLVDGGVDVPFIDYARAVEAALRGDDPGADAALKRALDRGWFDATAFDTDLVWREHAQAEWLLRHRRALEGAMLAERDRLETLAAAP